jgi:phage terminase large subunit
MTEIKIKVGYNYIQLDEAFKNPNKTTAVLQGSSSSGKTYSVLQRLIQYCTENENKTVAIFRYDKATCRDSVAADFLKLMSPDYYNLYDAKSWNKVESIYTFNTGSRIIFKGAQDTSKLRGPRQDIAFLNECTEIPKDSYDQIKARTKGMMLLDFNPCVNAGYFYDLEKDEATTFIRSTFRQNPSLPDTVRLTILGWEPTVINKQKGTADSYLWDVYANGVIGKQEGVIFSNWSESDFFPERQYCDRYGYGLDFGYSNDPTALIECGLHQGTLYIRECLYEKELVAQHNPTEPSIASIEGRLDELGIAKDVRIYADNARPEVIQALRNAGYSMMPSVKGSGSILSGIDVVRQYPMKVYNTSQNLKIELSQYTWAKTGHGIFTDKPIDKYNHLLDSLRYFCGSELKQNPMVSRKRRNGRVRVAKGAVGGGF